LTICNFLQKKANLAKSTFGFKNIQIKIIQVLEEFYYCYFWATYEIMYFIIKTTKGVHIELNTEDVYINCGF